MVAVVQATALRRNLGINQIVRESERHSENQEHASDQQSALRHDSRQVSDNMQITMDHRLNEKRVERRDRGCLNRRGDPN